MRYSALLAAGLTCVTLASTAVSEAPPRATAPASGPVLAELFTSQSCSSCPPAEALFSELAERDDLVVIEWHVDYWDDLVYGRAGKWEDPYSDAANTERQRAYNVALRGTRSVYTPQAIINGQTETVGSRTRGVSQLVGTAGQAKANIHVTGQTASIAPFAESDSADAEVMFVTLLPRQSTNVRRGENKGRRLASRNVAIDTEILGDWKGHEAAYDLPNIEDGYKCAIIVQDKESKQVLGARYCGNG